jgi:hypothetical protein
MRPVGDIARAMRQAAEGGPGTVRDLACRAQVGYGLARCTATRLVQRGDLVVVSEQRPMVLSVPPSGDGLGVVLSELHRSFWETPPSGQPDQPDQADQPGEGFAAL